MITAQLRRIQIDISPTVDRKYFDLDVHTSDEDFRMERSTPEKIHNLLRAEINRAIESFD